MKSFTRIAFAAVFASTCAAAVTKLAPEDRKALIRGGENIHLVLSTKEIPQAVADACAAVIPGHEFRLANPGEPFQVTDVLTNPDLPRRRLIWAASIPGYHVVHYESGGFAHSYHILLVASGNAPKTTKVVWSALAHSALKTYDDFLTALKEQKLDDTLDYHP